jgi:hypothetical protein
MMCLPVFLSTGIGGLISVHTPLESYPTADYLCAQSNAVEEIFHRVKNRNVKTIQVSTCRTGRN